MTRNRVQDLIPLDRWTKQAFKYSRRSGDWSLAKRYVHLLYDHLVRHDIVHDMDSLIDFLTDDLNILLPDEEQMVRSWIEVMR